MKIYNTKFCPWDSQWNIIFSLLLSSVSLFYFFLFSLASPHDQNFTSIYEGKIVVIYRSINRWNYMDNILSLILIYFIGTIVCSHLHWTQSKQHLSSLSSSIDNHLKFFFLPFLHTWERRAQFFRCSHHIFSSTSFGYVFALYASRIIKCILVMCPAVLLSQGAIEFAKIIQSTWKFAITLDHLRCQLKCCYFERGKKIQF